MRKNKTMEDTPQIPSVESHSNQEPKPKKLHFNSLSRRSPYIIIFVIVFAAIGGYILISSFAATVALTKVWSTASDWNTGALSNSVVTGNSVALAKSAATASSASATKSTTQYYALNKTSAAAAPVALTDLALDRPTVASST